MPTVQVPVQLTVEHLMAVVKQLSPAELHEFMQQLAAWQQYNGQQNRDTVNALLATAAGYAAAGNYEQCWHWYDRAQNVVR